MQSEVLNEAGEAFPVVFTRRSTVPCHDGITPFFRNADCAINRRQVAGKKISEWMPEPLEQTGTAQCSAQQSAAQHTVLHPGVVCTDCLTLQPNPLLLESVVSHCELLASVKLSTHPHPRPHKQSPRIKQQLNLRHLSRREHAYTHKQTDTQTQMHTRTHPRPCLTIPSPRPRRCACAGTGKLTMARAWGCPRSVRE